MPRFSAKELADMVGGKVVGPGEVTIENVRALELAGENDLAFLRDEAGKARAGSCRAAVLITPVALENYSGTMVVCEDAEVAMATVLATFAQERFPPPEGVSRLASVSPSATLGQGVAVGDYAVIGEGAVIGDAAVIHPQVYVGRGCRIGARTVLHANVSVHHNVVIGSDCVIHYNTAIGSAGFGFLQRGGRHVEVPQVGTVRIGGRVRIGALNTVDRGTLEATVIEDGVKTDDHCHIAHNCHIAADCIIAGGSVLGGSVRLGKGVILAGDVAVKDHVTVGDGAIIGAGSGVHNDVPPGAVMWGYPARPLSEQRRIVALLGRLPQMLERLRRLEKELETLRGHPNADT